MTKKQQKYSEPGPWDSEPDDLTWTDEATGLACHVIRHMHSGHLCGYVRIPVAHPLYRVSYNSPVPQSLADEIERVKSSPIGKRGVFDIFCFALSDGENMPAGMLFNVHGGITYSDTEDDGYWYGFDGAHCDDLSPGMSRYGMSGTYRDIEYVKQECASLAAQLHRLMTVAA